jgi:hypothetical protein
MNPEDFIHTLSFLKEGVMKQTEVLQNQFHDFCKQMQAKNPKLEYQDLLSLFLFMRIAELQYSERLQAQNS